MTKSDTPTYFHGILNKRIIVANDASIHPDTLEFKLTGTRGICILSMMAGQVYAKDDLSGIVCLEHGTRKKVDPTEQNPSHLLLQQHFKWPSKPVKKSRRGSPTSTYGTSDNQPAVAQKNEELEQFVYIASHDLKEPLNNAKTMAGLLRGQIRKPENLRFVDYIEQSADRMSRLISDLLSYGVIGRERRKDEVDLNELMEELKGDLAVRIQETNGSVK